MPTALAPMMWLMLAMVLMVVAPVYANFENGQTLAPLMEAYKSGASNESHESKLMAIEYEHYVVAGYDVMIAVDTICDSHATREQVVGRVTAFVDQNPDMIESPAFELTYLALNEVYACSKVTDDQPGASSRSDAARFFVGSRDLGQMAAEYENFVFGGPQPDYLKVAAFSGYVSGAHDALMTAGAICSEFESRGQLADLVADYALRESGEAGVSAVSLFTDALIEMGDICKK